MNKISEKIIILLPVHNDRDRVRYFVESLLKQTNQSYHMLLIDDGSKDGTVQYVKEKIKNISVLKGNGNLWWAGSLQLGYKWLCCQKISSEKIVLLINCDTEFEPDFLDKAIIRLEGVRNIFLLPGCFDKHSGNIISSGIHVDWAQLTFKEALEQKDINCLSTRGLFMKFGDFKRNGGFH